MGRLIVIEGLDGSGKQTLTRRLRAALADRGADIATMTFPRYGTSVHADLVRDGLYGRLGDLSDSVYGMALLFALDRRDAAEPLRALIAAHDVVLLDRYVSSNAAYGAARLGGPDTPTDFPDWLRGLEIDRFALPVPDLQLLLDTPADLAAARTRSRAETDQDRQLDRFEADGRLQENTRRMYLTLAAASYLSPWRVLDPHESIDQLVGRLTGEAVS